MPGNDRALLPFFPAATANCCSFWRSFAPAYRAATWPTRALRSSGRHAVPSFERRVRWLLPVPGQPWRAWQSTGFGCHGTRLGSGCARRRPFLVRATGALREHTGSRHPGDHAGDGERAAHKNSHRLRRISP